MQLASRKSHELTDLSDNARRVDRASSAVEAFIASCLSYRLQASHTILFRALSMALSAGFGGLDITTDIDEVCITVFAFPS